MTIDAAIAPYRRKLPTPEAAAYCGLGKSTFDRFRSLAAARPTSKLDRDAGALFMTRPTSTLGSPATSGAAHPNPRPPLRREVINHDHRLETEKSPAKAGALDGA